MRRGKFRLGRRRVLTRTALRAILDAGHNPHEFVRRHKRGDWGEVSAQRAQENDLAVWAGLRIVSAYHTAKGRKLVVVTEDDRSVTIILLAEEYEEAIETGFEHPFA